MASNNRGNTASNSNITLQTVIDDHIKARNTIYADITNPEKQGVATALGSLLLPPTTTEEIEKDPGPLELRALINTSLQELTPLARKAKYLEIQDNFLKYYKQTEATNRQVSTTYAEALDKVNEELRRQQNEITDLETEFEAAKRGESTHYRQMTMSRYNLDKANYYLALYTVYTVVLGLILVIIGVLGSTMLGVLSRSLCLLLTTTVIVFLAMYTIYHVYFKHPVRDNMVWRKYKWSASKPTGGNCHGSGSNAASNADDSVERRAASIAQSTMN